MPKWLGWEKNDKISREEGIDFCFFLVARLTRGGGGKKNNRDILKKSIIIQNIICDFAS